MRQFIPLSILFALQAFAQTPTTKSRVMVILDNSRSMQATPANDDDWTFRSHRLTRQLMTDDGSGIYVCDPASAIVTTNCKNKFCQGQCVMHNVFDPFVNELDFGFATYYQYYTKYQTKVSATTNNAATNCAYDVLAAANEDAPSWINKFWSKETSLPTCKLSNVNDAVGKKSVMDTYNYYAYEFGELQCQDRSAGTIAAASESVKTCAIDAASPDATNWITNAKFGDSSGNNRFRQEFRFTRNSLKKNTSALLYSGTVKPFQTTQCRSGGACSTPVATYALASTSTQLMDASWTWLGGNRFDGKTWNLFDLSVIPSASASGFVASDWNYLTTTATTCNVGATMEATSDTGVATDSTNVVQTLPGGGGWNNLQCSTNNRCDATLINSVASPGPQQTWYYDRGASYAVGFNKNTGQPVNRDIYGPILAGNYSVAACPSVSPITNPAGFTNASGCAPGNRCDVSAGVATNQDDTTKFTYNTSSIPAGYLANGSITEILSAHETNTTPKASACPATLTVSGLTSGSSTVVDCGNSNNVPNNCVLLLQAAPTPGEGSTRTCVYKARIQPLVKKQYSCRYTNGTYTYTGPPANSTCRWQVKRYEWRVRPYLYNWKMAGGEIVNIVNDAVPTVIEAPPAETYCRTPARALAQCPNKLGPTELAALPGWHACNQPGRECRLHWGNIFGTYNALTNPWGASDRGRQHNATWAANWIGASKFCRSIDYGGSPVVNNTLTASKSLIISSGVLSDVGGGGWCSGQRGLTQQSRDTYVISSDPYSPTSSNLDAPAVAGGLPLASFHPNSLHKPCVSGACAAGDVYSDDAAYSLTQVAHGVNPLALVNATPTATSLPAASKVVGWSRLPDGTPLMSAGIIGGYPMGDPIAGLDQIVPLFRPLPNLLGSPATGASSLPEIRSSILNMSMASDTFPIVQPPVDLYGAPLDATCTNGYQDESEAAVDCGRRVGAVGVGCPACPTDPLACTVNADCIQGAGKGRCDVSVGECISISASKMFAMTGHNTPLYGSLTNFKDYLRNELVDPLAKCRTYAAVLVTDGKENQGDKQIQHPGQSGITNYADSNNDGLDDPALLGAIVKELRESTIKTNVSGSTREAPNGGVKTYIVGFGSAAASDPNLAEMAVRAGTGQVYTAADPAELKAKLALIFNNLLESRYARSRPSLVRDGVNGSFYVAYFDIIGSGLQRKGYLDAFDLGVVSAGTLLPGCTVAPCPSWQFDKKLDNQGSRYVITRIDGANSNTASLGSTTNYPTSGPLDLVATTSGAAWNTFAANVNPFQPLAKTTATVNFLLNPTKNAPYVVGGIPPLKTSRLSDIEHSSPAVIGPPSADSSWPGFDSEIAAYTAFKAANAARPTRIVVGSNTGLIHGICEQTGVTTNCSPNATNARGIESWSILPPVLQAKLKNTQTGAEKMVDGSFGAADICTDPDCTLATNWQTAVIGGMRDGSNALVALDLTSASDPKLMFEFTANELGNTWSPPSIGRALVGTSSHWLGVLGGGYDNVTPLRGNSIMMLDLNTHRVATSTGPTQYAKFRLDINSVSCDSMPMGPGCIPKNNVPARVTLVREGKTSKIRAGYVGDTQGRISVVRMSGGGVGSWAPNYLFDPANSACTNSAITGSTVPVFGALDATSTPTALASPFVMPFAGIGIPPPIFQSVLTKVSSGGDVTILAGTGNVNAPTDTNAGTNAEHFNYFYSIHDNESAATCQGAPLWVRRFEKDEKMLSLGTVSGPVVFVPVFKPAVSGNCSERGDSRIYAFYAETGLAAKVFDPPTASPPGTPRAHISDCIGCGIISDLQFVKGTTSNTGKLFYAREDGKPQVDGVTGVSEPAKIKSFQRVK
jgi:hypothetical protein